MEKLKIYLDTSVINFLFADDAPDFKKITVQFFEKFIKPSVYDFFISDIVISEINMTKDIIKRELLFKKIDDYYINTIEYTKSGEVLKLAKSYISNNVFSENSINDALHVATAVIHNFDILLSWNFRHLANIEREKRIHAVNLINNYPVILRILTPLEVYNENL